ncbi:UxaA family hydrolase [Mangrovibacterium marinum]|uniref:D-altronate dehydratase n=1 Tax=Mangrovibacterium marinum TaxID=1639118 RepID=A0A2T5C0J5_9BACT|nr:altronate dehydratase family protein [Mangrovibacterium marinum]PTN08135.1 D-altronate dehydratase [Mangrovibacterium marinum]
MANYIKINPLDNVIIALKDFSNGELIDLEGSQLKVLNDVPRGHKIAVTNIAEGQDIIKYGAPIGHATAAILPGEYVHVHNTKTNLSGTISYEFSQKLNQLAFANQSLTFKGYKRSSGEVGIRNELWIVPTVGCVNGQAEQIINLFKEQNDTRDIDSIHVFKHAYGCSQLGDDHTNTQKALAQLIKHPNAGGVLVLGLGCENNQIDHLKKFIGQYDSARIKFLVAQDVEDEVEEGLKLFQEIYEQMRHDKREEVPFSSLKVGLKCGGSDGLSGITANPLVGMFSDFLVAQGGSTILTEVPEMFGAEHLLMERSESRKVFNKTVDMINGFKEYYLKHDLPVYENPSPGNKKGGITTLEDKSLGCTQKGGVATVTDVLAYAEPIKKNGLNLLCAPGNDLVAASALGFSGCQIVLFTTGRGTPFGSFVPTMKISTNTPLSIKKSNWIDFNAGRIVEDQTIEETLAHFIAELKNVAEGKKLKHELSGFKEIAIFKTGITL